MLLRASTILQDDGISINIKKSLFLSIITIQQAVMASALRHSLMPGHSESMATKSLSILRNMQGINLDNAVFESWRFCFNLSLDMLANEPRALTRYLDNLLQSSPLSRNPLSTKFHKTLFSKNVDDVDVTWLLIVVESTSTIIQSPDTCQRIFNHCFEGLIHMQGSQNKELMELYQSVVLSFFTSKYELFSSRGSDFIAHVLRDSTSITDRQFQVIFTSLYRLSLASEPSKAIEDPLHILSDIKDEFRKSQDVAVQEKLLSTIVQMLPIMRPSFLLRNLKYADASIQQLDTSNRLREKFNDVCTTEMDSERAVITVKYMLSRNEEKYEERARL
ncbi:protein of unknown function [Taphrina deformans PYCC 5710]|uniref:Uncharacterized protein n=1 Tax=Taphrina deformans (strain PYCC 5710 / ATCC 11124 / CBS 356.35 / IMI 108563 / JCM 9778 / NBRC 8474) TaxID=1097556 RepID=R4XL34_TAPDE|nr:protein of unknown function [Taphrina deformans PYCC 5710]|eukprot:CCG84024.1 protein of unknown function [Taphrina deformans PYCC 5710]